MLQDRGDKRGAIEAYEGSLRLRPNRTVRERLATLDAAAAAAADPLQPVAMEGAFPTFAAYCKNLDNADDRPACAGAGPEEKLAKPEKPFLEARLLERGTDNDGGVATCYLAVRVAAGWFVHDLGACREDSHLTRSYKVLAFELGDVVPGGSKELLLRTSEDREEREEREEEGWGLRRKVVSVSCEGRLVLCAPDRDGHPHCLKMQNAHRNEYCGSSLEWQWQLQPIFTADGQVEVRATGKPNADAKALMGKRPLAFP